ncbi:MAG: polymerase subunit alpha, partial [Petrotoga sp.]|nr:polymerase subunit alpha [Petrotoga sp.]
MKILGPVITSKSIGKSYLQLRDLFSIAKRYEYNCIVLSEPHPRSWVSFIVYAQKYRIKPIILYETANGKYLLQTNNDIRSAIMHYNGLGNNLRLKKIDLDLPYVKYPTDFLKDIFKDEESLCIKDGLKYQNELSIFSNIETYYNIGNYRFDEYKVTDYNLTDTISQKDLTLEEKRRLSYELNIIKSLDENILSIYVGPIKANTILVQDGWVGMGDFSLKDRGWFKQMKEANKLIYTDAYVDAITDKMVVTIATPVYDNGELLGAFGIDLAIDQLPSIISQHTIKNEGYAFLVDTQGLVLYHPNEEKILTENITEISGNLGEIGKQMISGNTGIGTYDYDGKSHIIS